VENLENYRELFIAHSYVLLCVYGKFFLKRSRGPIGKTKASWELQLEQKESRITAEMLDLIERNQGKLAGKSLKS
jgi:hypothetical protein